MTRPVRPLDLGQMSRENYVQDFLSTFNEIVDGDNVL